jgi:uncharacterized membrane protein YfcA
LVPPHALPYAIVTTVVAIAAALQAGTGMGLALFAAPLLALVDPALVPGPMLCAVVALSVAVGWRERVFIDRRVLGLALSGLLGGSVVGALALVVLAGMHLAAIFAAAILATVLLSVLGLHPRASVTALLIAGAAAGILGTLFGVHGPPIALVLQHEPPERLRATLCAFFAVGCVISLLALAIVGAFGVSQIGAGLQLMPGAAIGFVCAPILSRVIDRRRARIAVLTISSLSAVALLLR